jgi:hypothetical protein
LLLSFFGVDNGGGLPFIIFATCRLRDPLNKRLIIGRRTTGDHAVISGDAHQNPGRRRVGE